MSTIVAVDRGAWTIRVCHRVSSRFVSYREASAIDWLRHLPIAALTRGLRVLIPLVLDNRSESELPIPTPALCRHATTLAIARLRNDWGCLAEALLRAFLPGCAAFATSKPHLCSTALRLAAIAVLATRSSRSVTPLPPFLSRHAAIFEFLPAAPADRRLLVVRSAPPPQPPSATAIPTPMTIAAIGLCRHKLLRICPGPSLLRMTTASTAWSRNAPGPASRSRVDVGDARKQWCLIDREGGVTNASMHHLRTAVSGWATNILPHGR
jgi:hypothetical protein